VFAYSGTDMMHGISHGPSVTEWLAVVTVEAVLSFKRRGGRFACI